MPKAPPVHRQPWQLGARQRASKARDQVRGTAASRGYDADWFRLRARIIKSHPFCSAKGCGATDRLQVDHIVSIRQAPHRRLDPSNLRVLCHSCHSRRTGRDQARPQAGV